MSIFWCPPRIPGNSKSTSQPKNSFSIQGFEHFGRISSQPPAFPLSVFWNLGGFRLQWCIFLTQTCVTSVCPIVWRWLCLKDVWNAPSIHQGCPFRCWVRRYFLFDRSSSVRFFAAKSAGTMQSQWVSVYPNNLCTGCTYAQFCAEKSIHDEQCVATDTVAAGAFRFHLS